MVRLADYLCCEGGLALLLRTVESLRDAFETKAILLTQVAFGQETPTLTEAMAASAVGTDGPVAGGEGDVGALAAVSFHASEEEVRQVRSAHKGMNVWYGVTPDRESHERGLCPQLMKSAHY